MGCTNSKTDGKVQPRLMGPKPMKTEESDVEIQKANQPPKAKKKKWSLFGFGKKEEPEPEVKEEEPVETRPPPQSQWFIKSIRRTRSFGNAALATPNEWPLDENLPVFDHSNPVRLTKVSYKTKFGGNFPLAGIQLHFSNGMESPLYQTKDAIEREWEVKSREIFDKKRTIKKINVLVREYAYIHRIKFVDEKDLPVLDLVFDDREQGRWGSCELEEGEGVVGIYCSTSESFPQCITRLGFIVGKFEEQVAPT